VMRSLRTIDELTQRAQSEMRRFIFEWGPEGIGDGLVSALERHVETLQSEGVSIDVTGPTRRLPLTRAVETQLFGIGREALANVLRHSRANYAHVAVKQFDTGVALFVADDGCGFDPRAAHAGHFGLDSMRSRADEIGAFLDVTSRPGAGTVVHVEVPLTGDRDGG
jgi:signal transduction histidine kinase